MWTDYALELASNQAITEDAAGAKVIDAGAEKDLGVGEPIGVFCRVGTAFNTLDSLTVTVQTYSAADFSDAVTLSTKVIALAALTANSAHVMPSIPPGAVKRYVRALFDVTGTDPTTGTITVGLIPGADTKPGNVAVKY